MWLGEILFPILADIGTTISVMFNTVIMPALAELATALGAVLAPILPIVLVIAAVTAGLVLLYKHSDEVVDFFDNLGQKFKNLGNKTKLLIVITAAIFFPITALIATIYGLAKLFKSIKKIGFEKTMKNLSLKNQKNFNFLKFQ